MGLIIGFSAGMAFAITNSAVYHCSSFARMTMGLMDATYDASGLMSLVSQCLMGAG